MKSLLILIVSVTASLPSSCFTTDGPFGGNIGFSLTSNLLQLQDTLKATMQVSTIQGCLVNAFSATNNTMKKIGALSFKLIDAAKPTDVTKLEVMGYPETMECSSYFLETDEFITKVV